MKEIILTKKINQEIKQFILQLDDEDYDLVSKKTIHINISGSKTTMYPCFYIAANPSNNNTKSKYKRVSIGVFLMNFQLNKEVSYIDKNSFNNQRSNLRLVTQVLTRQEELNESYSRISKYHPVVYKNLETNYWTTSYNGRNLGEFEHEDDAFILYNHIKDRKHIPLELSFPIKDNTELDLSSISFIGVRYIKSKQLYKSTIRLNNHPLTVGYFTEKIDAALAHDKIQLYLNPDSTRINFHKDYPKDHIRSELLNKLEKTKHSIV